MCNEHVTKSECGKENARNVVEDLKCVTCWKDERIGVEGDV
jgi:hypothetical protein